MCNYNMLLTVSKINVIAKARIKLQIAKFH